MQTQTVEINHCDLVTEQTQLIAALALFIGDDNPIPLQESLENLFKDSNVQVLGMYENAMVVTRLVSSADGEPYENRHLSLQRNSCSSGNIIYRTFQHPDHHSVETKQHYTVNSYYQTLVKLMA